MRGAWIIAALVVGTVAAPARAGVYNTAEPWPQPRPFAQFQQDLAAYRSATLKEEDLPPDSLGAHYVRRIAELEAEDARGMLTLEGRINLGAYLIRRGKYNEAVAVLEKAQTSRNFMLRANLATAYELAGVPDRALLYRQLALSSWPATYPGWDTVQVNFYRKAEQMHLTLLQLRQEDARRQANRSALRLDNLFPKVQFIGPGGQYEAGTIAPAQWSEIPNDAGGLVEQLLLWMPFDARLQWMLGELLNANGDVSGAAAMMKLVVNMNSDPTQAKWDTGAPPELREHYRIVSDAAEARQKVSAALMAAGDQYLNLKLLCALAPRGMGLGAGDLIQEASWPAIVAISEPPAPKADTQQIAPPSSTTSAGWLPNWRALLVGFGAGAVVAWLLGYQIRQARLTKG
jgi:tetratricopeptide (TPR) repeat protein